MRVVSNIGHVSYIKKNALGKEIIESDNDNEDDRLVNANKNSTNIRASLQTIYYLLNVSHSISKFMFDPWSEWKNTYRDSDDIESKIDAIDEEQAVIPTLNHSQVRKAESVQHSLNVQGLEFS